ncbi:MAG TPA: DUF5684 domain-containing protein [Nitrolancea sp.]|nr:DUF5684 domain-containing protein [Nitrolancea sp.]
MMNSSITALLILVYIAVIVVEIAAVWRVFTKAGQPGWAAIIPIYNTVIFMRIVGRPGWWTILTFIPGVNIIVGIVVALDLAKVFGKSGAFAVGLIFLSAIFLPILGFGSARYQGGSIGTAGPSLQPAI